jgi:CRISPR system Cascade subunit CasA
MLTDPILVLETTGGDVRGTLPEALGRLCEGTLTGFEGLAAHQRYAWDLFLYQLAALALQRSGEAAAAEDDAGWRGLGDPQAWRARLEALTPGCADTAWSLVVPDLARPAFLQPPIGAATLGAYGIAGRTPDEIDVLVTAKDHDVKAARAGAAEPRHWLFALVALQTLQGYSGRGNFGIARMNGGFASRPLVMTTPRRDAATCFRRGVQAALRARAAALEGMHAAFAPDGLALLWLETWDRDEGLPTQRLDPLFIEICRRIRLARDPAGSIVAWGRPSDAARVAVPKERKGDLGDAWTPIGAAEPAALTVGAGGFDYRLVARLVESTEFKLPVAAQPRPDDPPDAVWMRCAVLVRGQGKTEGLHERWVRLPGAARRAKLGVLAKAMVRQTREAKQALSIALLNFLQAAPAKLDFKDKRAEPWLDMFEQAVDGVFFDHLFDRATAIDEIAAETKWKAALVDRVRALFRRAAATLSPPGSRREKATAVAALVMNAALGKAKLLPERPDTEPDTEEDPDERAA